MFKTGAKPVRNAMTYKGKQLGCVDLLVQPMTYEMDMTEVQPTQGTGFLYTDTMAFFGGMRITQPVCAIVEPDSSTFYALQVSGSGQLGLSPQRLTRVNGEQTLQLSLIENMMRAGIIKEGTFAIQLEGNRRPHLQIGGYNKSKVMHYAETRSNDTWGLEARLITIGSHVVSSTDHTKLDLVPNLPFIYVPSKDFMKVA